MIGHPMYRNAADVLEKLGGTASNFAARQLTTRMASDADLILAMSRSHRDAVLELAPRQLHRTFTLHEAAHLAADANALSIADLAALRPRIAPHFLPDIPDPIGQSEDVFARIGSQIAELLPPIVELCRRSSAPAI